LSGDPVDRRGDYQRGGYRPRDAAREPPSTFTLVKRGLPLTLAATFVAGAAVVAIMRHGTTD